MTGFAAHRDSRPNTPQVYQTTGVRVKPKILCERGHVKTVFTIHEHGQLPVHLHQDRRGLTIRPIEYLPFVREFSEGSLANDQPVLAVHGLSQVSRLHVLKWNRLGRILLFTIKTNARSEVIREIVEKTGTSRFYQLKIE